MTHVCTVPAESWVQTDAPYVLTFFPLPFSTDACLTGDPSNMQRNTKTGRHAQERTEARAEGWGSGVLSRREKLSFPHL